MRNVCELIEKQFKAHPDKLSIVAPINNSNEYKSYTFSELEIRINKFVNKFKTLGIKPQDKVLVFIKPNIDFCAITFALFKLGAISIFIDPGMPKKMFFKSIRKLRPDVLIGLPVVHIFSWFLPTVFKSVRVYITNSSFSGFRAKSLYSAINEMPAESDIYTPSTEDLAAILFTSGGTGPAKGVEYTHDIFINQTLMLQNEFNLTSADTDIPGFPLFSFFTLAMGMTSVIPDMDFAKPASCNPELLYKNITDAKASFLAGSPAIWERLADYCIENKLVLPSVKFVTMFGAPVKNSLHEKFQHILPRGTTYTPYGATECLPVTNISGQAILEKYKKDTDNGAGICVGAPLAGVQVQIINQDENGIGEIIVSSPNVTKKYYQNESETKESKLNLNGVLWHKMGDVGYLKDDLLWFCGRTKHIVKVGDKNIYPVCVEGIVNKVLKNKRSAVIQDGHHVSVVIEDSVDESTRAKVISHLDHFDFKKVYFYPKFPVDIRHNIKIDRIKLTQLISEFK